MRMVRRYRFGRLWAVAALGFLVGCPIHVPLKPVAPEPMKKLPIPIALHIEKNLRDHPEQTKLSTPYGGRRPYAFNVGEVMASAIEAQMRSIFKAIKVTGSPSTPQSLRDADLAGEMQIGLKDSKIDIRFVPDIIGTVAEADYELELEASFRDTEGNNIFSDKSHKVRGKGHSSVKTSVADKFAFEPGIHNALQDALQQLSQVITLDASLDHFTQTTLVNMMKPGVVVIRAVHPDKGPQTGTGFIVELTDVAAYIVTALHVVEGDRRPKVKFFTQPSLWVSASVVGQGKGDLDLAVLVVKGNLPSRLLALQLAPSKLLHERDEVRMVGHPLAAEAAPWSVIKGNITVHTRRRIFIEQTTIDHGNSGGPVIKEGQVVGLVTDVRREVSGGAIPAATIQEFLERWGVHAIRGGA